MRDILRWLLHWLSPLAVVETGNLDIALRDAPKHVVAIRHAAKHAVAIRDEAKHDVALADRTRGA